MNVMNELIRIYTLYLFHDIRECDALCDPFPDEINLEDKQHNAILFTHTLSHTDI